MTQILNGKEIANQIKSELKKQIEGLVQSGKQVPTLALLLVGANPASQSYVRSKEKACEFVGMNSIINLQAETISEPEVINIIETWNADDNINGILVQLPLPKHIDENKIIEMVAPEKDVDGFHPINAGKLMIGLDGLFPCTPMGIVEILKRSSIDTQGKHIVVLGRSNIVGKPIANLMLQKNKHANSTVTVCHSGTKGYSKFTQDADILIVAIGSPELIKANDIKAGVVIIDVGINRVDADNERGYRLVGDVDYDSCFEKASAITPVPGGVGPMTIAMLLNNTLKASNN